MKPGTPTQFLNADCDAVRESERHPAEGRAQSERVPRSVVLQLSRGA